MLFFLVLLLASCSKTTKEGEVFVSSVSLSQISAEMLVGETIQLKATILPGNATDKTVSWSSSDSRVLRPTPPLHAPVVVGRRWNDPAPAPGFDRPISTREMR